MQQLSPAPSYRLPLISKYSPLYPTFKILYLGLERPKFHIRTEQQVPKASREVKNFKQTLMFNTYLKSEKMKQQNNTCSFTTLMKRVSH